MTDVKGIISSKINLVEKDKCHMISLIKWDIKNKPNKHTHTDTKNRVVVTRREGKMSEGGSLDWTAMHGN